MGPTVHLAPTSRDLRVKTALVPVHAAAAEVSGVVPDLGASKELQRTGLPSIT